MRKTMFSMYKALLLLALLPVNLTAQAPPSSSPAGSPTDRSGSVADTEEQRIDDLVAANHILFEQGILDAYGHVSVRSLKNPKHYFLSRSRAPGLVTRADIMEFDENSNPVDQRGRPMYSERFIHGEIFRAHPEVQAVVHSHAASVLPFSVTGIPLRPILHMAGFLPQMVPMFEIREVAGPDNGMLVSDQRLGTALAGSLGTSPVVLMRGHGMAVTGPTVRHAVFRAIYTQLNAQVELEALRLGPVTYLNAQEAARVDAVNEGTLMSTNARQWQLWLSQAEAQSGGSGEKPAR